MDIEIALDNYDDIFSDFDIRDYRSRAISRDFFEEILLRMKDVSVCPERVEIILTIPKKEREKKVEKIISKRIRRFFEKKAAKVSLKRREATTKGVLFILVGVLFLLLSSFAGYFLESNLATYVVVDFLFLPSWFFTWNGLEKLIYTRERLKKIEEKYKCLEKANITFVNEEDYYED